MSVYPFTNKQPSVQARQSLRNKNMSIISKTAGISATFCVITKLLSECRKGTQTETLLQIFLKRGYCSPIAKREIEKTYGLFTAFKDVNFNGGITINDIEQLVLMSGNLPGDVQRQLRSFYDKYHSYGLQRDGEGDAIRYCWLPISEEEFDWIRGKPLVPRNIFGTDADRDDFINSKQGKCEICKSDTRLAIDHWRAHSIYGVDSPAIAALLCEQCNNTHHNYDGAKIMLKRKDNLQCVKNWIAVETRIRENGFYPNATDAAEQNRIIDQVAAFYQDNFEFVELLAMKIV